MAPTNYPSFRAMLCNGETDRFSMYNAYELATGPSHELLAVHTPLGLLEPTGMVFGEMNAGTVACAATPAILRTLPDSTYLRTAAYVDDHAQGSHTFADLLRGYTDFLALCKRENWTLNATKTLVGFPSIVFFGFHVDINGTRLADKNLDPIKRMVPPTNLPELRMTLGVFVQSTRFIPQYAHIVRPLTELTRCAKGLPVPFIWTPERQQTFDHVRNLLLDGIHLAPPNYLLPFTVEAMRQMMGNPTASISSATCLREHNSPSPNTRPLPPQSASPHPTAYTRFPTISKLALS
jgi:hypothetical protein